MKNDLHLVCPHCQSINRVPTAKLSEHPNCGRCQQPLVHGRAHRVDHGDVLAPRGAQRPATVGRFLGTLVRAVQDDGPAVPASGAPARTQGQAGQGQYRGRTPPGRAVRHPQHSDARPVPGWAGDRASGWRLGRAGHRALGICTGGALTDAGLARRHPDPAGGMQPRGCGDGGVQSTALLGYLAVGALLGRRSAV